MMMETVLSTLAGILFTGAIALLRIRYLKRTFREHEKSLRETIAEKNDKIDELEGKIDELQEGQKTVVRKAESWMGGDEVDRLKKILVDNLNLESDVVPGHEIRVGEQKSLDQYREFVSYVAEEAESRLLMTCTTPLLGILKYEGGEYNYYDDYEEAIDRDEWQSTFCAPFLCALDKKVREPEESVDIEIACLNNNKMKHILNSSDDIRLPSNIHESYSEKFFSNLSDANENKRPRVMFAEEIPIYMAIRDYDIIGPGDRITDHYPDITTPYNFHEVPPLGTVSLISSSTLYDSLRKGKAPTDIAGDLVSFCFWDPNLLHFFKDLFRTIQVSSFYR